MANNLIELRGIKKIYGNQIKTEVLKGINLKIDKAEFLSIIGPSGSGKSTLLNILGTLDVPSVGAYIFDGNSIEDYNQNQLAKFRNMKIGFVFQFHHLLPEFTAIENVLMPFWIQKKPVKKEIIMKAERLLDMVGVLNKKSNMASNMSGGQQQRVAIARALINEPVVIFADEPTGNLDTEATEQVYSLFREINKELETTIVVVTHDRSLAAKSDRIIEVIDGNIVQDIRQ